MSALRAGLVAMAIAGQYANACLAETREGARHLTFDKYGNFAPFESKPARELMTDQEFESYGQALAKFDCETANRVLNTAFIRQYPLFKDAKLGPHCPDAPICFYWRNYARVNINEYGYCTTIRKLRKREREIRQQGISLPKYKMRDWPDETVYVNPLIEARDRAISLLIGPAEDGYRPALIKLADLIRRGDVFNAGQNVEYYLLKRACLVGGGCQDLVHRLEQLRTSIGVAQSRAIDKKAAARYRERPRIRLLLLGEQF